MNALTSPTSLAGLLVSLAILALILYRQVQIRPLETRLLLPIILIVTGLTSLRGGAHGNPLTATQAAVLAGLLTLDAGGLGALRAFTVRLWRNEDVILRQGNWLTAALWLVGLAIHEAVDAAAAIRSTTLLLYLGVTWTSQRLVLQRRARTAA